MLKDLVKTCRSYRRFFEDVPIPMDDLRDMVDTARLTASAANAQALRFRIVTDAAEKAGVFAAINWAGALKDWDGPCEGERPGAYIVIACDLSVGRNKQWDDGIAAQTIMLSAVEKGFGGCMIGSCRRDDIARALHIDTEAYSIDLVLALGKPKEEVVIVPVGEDGSTTYYRDANGVHYVPKRNLEDVML